jgi:hypothetical protein
MGGRIPSTPLWSGAIAYCAFAGTLRPIRTSRVMR